MPDELELTARLELGIKAAIEANYQAAGAALAGVRIYAAQGGEELVDVDRLVVSAINPDEELAHAGIHDVEVHLVLFSKMLDPRGLDGPARAKAHQKRAAACRAIFGEDGNHDTLVTQVRAHPGLGVSCFVQEGNDERGQSENGTCWVWRRQLTFTAHLEDE